MANGTPRRSIWGPTPAGTNSAPTFTGSPLAAHAHELPFQIPSTTTTRQIASATFGTGTSRAATAVSAPAFTGSALGTHSHTPTPNGTVSQPAFTGAASSVVQPYIVCHFWKRTA